MIKGLYIHIPFCRHICGYCDFARALYSSRAADHYLDHLEKELLTIGQSAFSTAYIGGGTPSALSEEQLERLLKMVNRFDIKGEYTIEINPETLTLEKALLMKQYGINRVSLGIQSFNEKLLEYMERSHRNIDVVMAMKYLDQAGIKNRSIDLMYGFADQTVGMLLDDLEKAVRMDVTHISIYDLEIHPNTLFGIRKYRKLDEETDGIMYQTIIDYLNEHSYRQYETSNFALNGYQSEHNRIYWRYEDYYGAGLGASSKIGFRRYDNTRKFLEYLKDNYRAHEERLSYADVRFEALMMNLRLVEGIEIADYDKRFETGILELYHQPIEKNVERGLLEVADGHLRATARGRMILNDVLVDFLPDQ